MMTIYVLFRKEAKNWSCNLLLLLADSQKVFDSINDNKQFIQTLISQSTLYQRF